MPSFDGDADSLALLIYGILFCGNGRRWFDGGPEEDGRAVADTAQDAAGVIGLFADTALSVRDKRIVIVKSRGACRGKAVSKFEAFDSAYGEYSFCQIGVQLFKYGVADPGGHSGDPACDHTAGGIALNFTFVQISSRFCGCIFVGHIQRIPIDLLRVEPVCINGYGTD